VITAQAYPLKRDLGLVGWQIRYEQRAFWRNRGRGVFTFAFPLMFLVIFASLFNGQHMSGRGGIPYNDFFVPGILAYGVITTTFVNMAISTAILRDEGVLKRMQGTPLPRWAYVAGRIGSTIVIVGAMTVVTLALGLAGAIAIITTATLLARAHLLRGLRFCGEHSIVIYLAFFLPMASTRALLFKTGLIPDVGAISLVVTIAGVLGALAIWRLALMAKADFLFERPDAFWIAPKKIAPRLQAAE